MQFRFALFLYDNRDRIKVWRAILYGLALKRAYLVRQAGRPLYIRRFNYIPDNALDGGALGRWTDSSEVERL